MSERITMDEIPLKSQFERFCASYQDMKNQVDLVDQELHDWSDQHEKLKKTGKWEEIFNHFDVNDEIRKRYDKAKLSCDIYASMLADFAYENKELLAAALKLEDKKKNHPLRANHMRRSR